MKAGTPAVKVGEPEVEVGVRVNVTLPKESGAVTDPEAKSCFCPTFPTRLKSKTLLAATRDVPLILSMPPIANGLLAEVVKYQPEMANAYPPEGAAALV